MYAHRKMMRTMKAYPHGLSGDLLGPRVSLVSTIAAGEEAYIPLQFPTQLRLRQDEKVLLES